LLGGRRLITRSGDDATPGSELLAGMLSGEIFPAVHPPDEPAASIEPSYELGRSVEHLVEHCLGQLAGEGVLLAGVVTTH
jgi:hypothetical protein